jgi:hypothetical protein
MNSQVPQRPEPSEGADKGGAAVTATIGLERDHRHRLRWWTGAVVPVSRLWPHEEDQAFRR